MSEDYMEINITFTIHSEDDELENQGNVFKNLLKNCELEYIKKGDHKKYKNGKISKLPCKNSTLYIRIISSNYIYNKDIIDIINVYDKLNNYFINIEYDAYLSIDIFYDKDYPLSLEFGQEVLELLVKNEFSLPISCYTKKNE
jgi:hypothetical protein